MSADQHYEAGLIEIYTTCDWCGEGLVYGEVVLSDGAEGVYCSGACAKAFGECDQLRELMDDYL